MVRHNIGQILKQQCQLLFAKIQPEILTHQNAEPEPGFELRSTTGESSMLTTRLHMLFVHLL